MLSKLQNKIISSLLIIFMSFPMLLQFNLSAFAHTENVTSLDLMGYESLYENLNKIAIKYENEEVYTRYKSLLDSIKTENNSKTIKYKLLELKEEAIKLSSGNTSPINYVETYKDMLDKIEENLFNNSDLKQDEKLFKANEVINFLFEKLDINEDNIVDVTKLVQKYNSLIDSLNDTLSSKESEQTSFASAIEEIDYSRLEDGNYRINIQNSEDEKLNIINKNAILSVKNGNLYLHIEIDEARINEDKNLIGYASNFEYEDKESKSGYSKAVIERYKLDKNIRIIDDSNNEYVPDIIVIKLNKDKINAGVIHVNIKYVINKFISNNLDGEFSTDVSVDLSNLTLESIDENNVNLEFLTKYINLADEYILNESEYEKLTIDRLKSIREYGDLVLNYDYKNQSIVDEATLSIRSALANLLTKSKQKINKNKLYEIDKKIDLFNLEDGKYYINIEVKHSADRDNKYSMANNAIGHSAILTVINGVPYITLDFKRLSIKFGETEMAGYLQKLWAFPNANNNDQGQPKFEAIIENYRKIDGIREKDEFESKDIPLNLTLPLVENKSDYSWMLIQVYVPVMESLGEKTGTQVAWIDFDKQSLRRILDLEDENLSNYIDNLNKKIDELNKWIILDEGSDDVKNAVKEEIKRARILSDYRYKSRDSLISGIESLDILIEQIKKFGNINKSKLADALNKAKKLVKNSNDVYSQDSINELKAVIEKAQKVFELIGYSQNEVDAYVEKLNFAINTLKKVETNYDTNADYLDRYNLADGEYVVFGEMIKLDRKTHSMANNAISHKVKITVKNGKKYATIQFKGLRLRNMFGYLSVLKYFDTGYKLSETGFAKGNLILATVDTYQLDKDNKRVSDNFGTDYPRLVTFAIIDEALKDGWIPLQVFVPIMESISAGTGTQSVFLKLNWDTLKRLKNGENIEEDNSKDSSNIQSKSTLLKSNLKKVKNNRNKHNLKNRKKSSIKNDITNRPITRNNSDKLSSNSMDNNSKNDTKFLIIFLIPTAFGLIMIIGGVTYKIYNT